MWPMSVSAGWKLKIMSSLNLVHVIGTELNEPFQIFGDSDEAYRIEGGSSTLIKRLCACAQGQDRR